MHVGDFLLTQIPTLLGFALLVLGYIVVRNTRALTSGHTYRANGLVIQNIPQKVSRKPGGREVVQYFPMVRFKARNGKQLKALSRYGTRKPLYKGGQQAPVFYNPANPLDFYVGDKKQEMKPMILLILIVGLVLVVLGLVLGGFGIAGMLPHVVAE